MIMAQDFTREERAQMHVEYVRQLEAGEMSGKEFVHALWSRVGFHELDAKGEWQSVKNMGRVAIYRLKCGDAVQVPFGGGWADGKISSFYGSEAGAIVIVGEMRLPFSLYELRVK